MHNTTNLCPNFSSSCSFLNFTYMSTFDTFTSTCSTSLIIPPEVEDSVVIFAPIPEGWRLLPVNYCHVFASTLFNATNLPKDMSDLHRNRCLAFVKNPMACRITCSMDPDSVRSITGTLCPICGLVVKDNWVSTKDGRLRRQLRIESLHEHLGMRHHLMQRIQCPAQCDTICASRGYTKPHRLLHHWSDNIACLAWITDRVNESESLIGLVKWSLGSTWKRISAEHDKFHRTSKSTFDKSDGQLSFDTINMRQVLIDRVALVKKITRTRMLQLMVRAANHQQQQTLYSPISPTQTLYSPNPLSPTPLLTLPLSPVHTSTHHRLMDTSAKPCPYPISPVLATCQPFSNTFSHGLHSPSTNQESNTLRLDFLSRRASVPISPVSQINRDNSTFLFTSPLDLSAGQAGVFKNNVYNGSIPPTPTSLTSPVFQHTRSTTPPYKPMPYTDHPPPQQATLPPQQCTLPYPHLQTLPHMYTLESHPLPYLLQKPGSTTGQRSWPLTRPTGLASRRASLRGPIMSSATNTTSNNLKWISGMSPELHLAVQNWDSNPLQVAPAVADIQNLPSSGSLESLLALEDLGFRFGQTVYE